MKRTILTAAAVTVALGIIAAGCLDRKPAAVCPVPIEIATNDVSATEFDGVDLLVMVDNSISMAAEQAILSTGFYTLINSLTKPLLNDPDWGYDAIDNMRVAVTSSNLGLMWGDEHSIEGSPSMKNCDARGDNGAFLITPTDLTNINVQDGKVSCESGGGQCPDGFTCSATDTSSVGVCDAPTSGGTPVTTVSCKYLATGATYASTSAESTNSDLTTQVACMAMQGTDGCGFEQQLEASLLSLQNNTDFIVDTHLLAVLIVSDEEDCSIESPDLFSTAEWNNSSTYLENLYPNVSSQQNVACNWSGEAASNKYLFDVSRYYDGLADLKGGVHSSVIFAAIVGVPKSADSSADYLCEGAGDKIDGCLSDANTAMAIRPVKLTEEDQDYIHFNPACTRDEAGKTVTEAKPGRRYVELAQQFGSNSYVYSICNEDWSPAMETIAEIIAKQMGSSCYSKQLDWSQLSSGEQPESCTSNGYKCGEAECDVMVRRQMGINEDDTCPAAYYTSVTQEEAAAYEDKKVVENVVGTSGEVTLKNVYCPLPRIATPRDCDDARKYISLLNSTSTQVGWYYCEKDGENFLNACEDGNDNDNDGLIDDEDPDCADCVADPNGSDCDSSSCSYGVEFTDAGKNVTSGSKITVQCLQQFTFADENCQEDSPSSCYDVNDNLDEDGNGVWNCTDGLDGSHSPDPNCCPLTVNDDNTCTAVLSELQDNCQTDVNAHYSSTNNGTADGFTIDSTNWMNVPACAAHVESLGCTTY